MANIIECDDGSQCSVAGALAGQLIVLFEQECPDQPGHGGLIREDADDVAAALDLAVEALDRVGGVVLGAVLGREAHVGQNVGFCVVHQASQFRHPRPRLVGDLAPLLAGGDRVVLGEGGVSGISCVSGHDGKEGAPPWPDGKN